MVRRGFVVALAAALAVAGTHAVVSAVTAQPLETPPGVRFAGPAIDDSGGWLVLVMFHPTGTLTAQMSVAVAISGYPGAGGYDTAKVRAVMRDALITHYLSTAKPSGTPVRLST